MSEIETPKVRVEWTSMDKASRFTEREIRLIDNCKLYAVNDPAGLPAHNLMIIIAKLCDLLLGKELEEATESPKSTLVWHCVNGIWFYDNLRAPWVMELDGEWHYSIPTHAKTGKALTKEDAMACVEKITGRI